MNFLVDEIWYEVIGIEVKVVGSSDKATSVIIPSEITYKERNYRVTCIGEEAFSDCTGLTAITIPNSVTSIGWSAFEGCTGLTAISIPNSVTSIGSSAFSGCTGLTAISIPNSVTSIGSWAFEGTSWFEKQANGVVYVNNVLYTYKGEMPQNTSIVVKEGTISIGEWAFRDCTGLTAITIPNSVTSIGNFAFKGCTRLTAITIPNSVTSIERDVFEGCDGLTCITLKGAVNYLNVRLIKTSGGFLPKSAFYINNYIENVKVESDRPINPQLFPQYFIFRAPVPNEQMAEGKWIELTIHDENNLWSAPITINSDFVKIIYPITMKCYETEAHQGCRIQLLGNVPHVVPKEINSETECSCIDVWESYDLVLKKLKSASQQSK